MAVGSCLTENKEPVARLSVVGVAFKVPEKDNGELFVLVDLLYWRFTPCFDAMRSHEVDPDFRAR